MVCLHNHVTGITGRPHIAVVTLLDLSASFDAVDHFTLMNVLRRRFGIGDDALGWMMDYLRSLSAKSCFQVRIRLRDFILWCSSGFSPWSWNIHRIC